MRFYLFRRTLSVAVLVVLMYIQCCTLVYSLTLQDDSALPSTSYITYIRLSTDGRKSRHVVQQKTWTCITGEGICRQYSLRKMKNGSRSNLKVLSRYREGIEGLSMLFIIKKEKFSTICWNIISNSCFAHHQKSKMMAP